MDEIIIQRVEDKLIIIVLENNEIVEYHEFSSNNMSQIGNIYAGTIKDVVPGNRTLFVDFGNKLPGFLQPSSFEKTYKRGDKVLVQVRKDEFLSKGAKLTESISIAGKYVVLLANSDVVTYSSKLESGEIIDLIDRLKTQLPHGFGAILRTEAKTEKIDTILAEYNELYKKYEEVKNASKSIKQGLIYEVNSIEKKLLLEFIKSTTQKIYINDLEIYNKLQKELENGPKSGILEYKDVDFNTEFGLQTACEKAMQRKIWLKSGGYIAIDKTEALTAIDVNTGKNIGKNGEDDVIMATNTEAAIEVMKQIWLKNIGGIIIIDFINLYENSQKEAILELLNNEKYKDRSKVEIFGFTRLGLVEITRKKL